MRIEDVEIKWLGNSGFLIKNSKIICIDPYNISDASEKADLIFLTHAHYDHCSVADIEKIIKPETKIFAPVDCQSKIVRFQHPVDLKVVSKNQELEFRDLKISVLPAYNVDKPFHPREEGVGYLINFGNLIIYHAGDTDVIPEMQKLTGHKQSGKKFVALLPVGGRFTMSAEEALDAVKIIKPDVVIPMHWGSVAGSSEDAEEFKELCGGEGIACEILEKS